MTQQDKAICLQLKAHVDQVNRTGTLSIPPDLYGKINEIYKRKHGRHIPACRSCMIDAIKSLDGEANG
jgi:hypothetical protein